MFAFTGDVHLEKPIVGLGGDVLGKQLDVIERILKWCVRSGVSELVVGGDLFDTPYPSQKTLVRLSDLLNAFRIRVTVIPGNHDMHSHEDHSLDVLSWMGRKDMLPLRIIMKPTVMEIDGYTCWVCPHPFVLDPPQKVDWCIGHFAWTGALRPNGTAHPSGSRPKGNWLIADFHEHQSQPKRFVYPGSPMQLRWDEKQPKGFLAVTDTWQFIRVKQSYSLNIKTVSSLSQVDALPDTDPQDKHPMYWMVRLDKGFVMPGDWQTKYPHIVRVDPEEKVKGIKDAHKAVVQFSEDNPLEGLDQWVTAKLRGIVSGTALPARVERIVKLGRFIEKQKD